jgi:hypothetical protein
LWASRWRGAGTPLRRRTGAQREDVVVLPDLNADRRSERGAPNGVVLPARRDSGGRLRCSQSNISFTLALRYQLTPSVQMFCSLPRADGQRALPSEPARKSRFM